MHIQRLFELIERHKFIVTEHPSRAGWEDEYDMIIERKRYINLARLKEQKKLFQKVDIRPRAPVYQNTFLGRLHSSEYEALNYEVLSQIYSYSERDQLAMVYAIHKTGLSPYVFPEGEILFTIWSNHVNIDTVSFIQDKGYYLRTKAISPSAHKGLPGASILYRLFNKISSKYLIYKM